ncbi:MAG TPA: Fic family protein [Mucilaginibacter sp.]|jgi:hypothetical protein|nr:Fic family protein [Mucilaginibacter sp.]
MKNFPLRNEMADLSHLLPEIVFASKESATSKQISKWVKDGTLKKLAPRVYTSRTKEDPEAIVKRNLFTIIGHLYPGILLSHRSAFEFEPTKTGKLFLTNSHNRKIQLPGVVLEVMRGPGPTAGDNQLAPGLFVSSHARAYMENLQPSRKPGPDSKTLTLPEIEERIEKVIRIREETGINQIRDDAKIIAKPLGMEQELSKFNKLVSAILNTNPSHILNSPVALARKFGKPYDPGRIDLFNILFKALNEPFNSYPDRNTEVNAFRNFAFFEAYFSNYIEGTEFEVDEAKQIISTGKPLATRDGDSHDILGSYKIMSDQQGMRLTPTNPDELIQILQYRHRVMLISREKANPGQFKDKNNRAGTTDFVDNELVRGTLIQGFNNYQNLQDPFAKALYMHFMISEVHPFLDGNGRVSRVMMNAELVKANQTRIIIPTVYRDDYIGAVKKLTKQQDPSAYIRMMVRAWQFSATIIGPEMGTMQSQLERSNAFLEPDQGRLQIIEPQSGWTR